MSRIKILIVDDHAIMRDGIQALLRNHENMEVVGEASEGREACTKALELCPDVVIMDLTMQGMDGMEATRRITKKMPKVKIVILSQHMGREYVMAAIKAGAKGYVPKQALSMDLISAIKEVYRGDTFLYPSAVAALVQGYLHSPEPDPYDKLTPREREILKLIAEGYTSKEITKMLVLSLKTVLNIRNNMMSKLDIHNKTELVKYALRKGLIILE